MSVFKLVRNNHGQPDFIVDNHGNKLFECLSADENDIAVILVADDMLAALNNILDNHVDYKFVQEFGGYTLPDEMLSQIRAVIKKAEGK